MDLQPVYHISPKLREILESSDAAKFRLSGLHHAQQAVEQIQPRLPSFEGHYNLDHQTMLLALDAAYLDLIRDVDFHDYEDGPAAEKTGAAIAAWTNQLRPLHFSVAATQKSPSRTLVNPVFALTLGWVVTSAYKGVAVQREDWEAQVPEIREILYGMQWRRPGYRQMTLSFFLATFM